jgi:AraC-like DNA-binding protein
MVREHLGRSPKEELTRRRLSIARDLLLNSNEKIAAISQICGWSNPQPFHVAFVAAEGVSPGVFRKQGGRLLRE